MDDGLAFQEGRQLLGGPSEVAANEADIIFGEGGKICHCEASSAPEGHIHEEGGNVLCLHGDDEDGSNCPQAHPLSRELGLGDIEEATGIRTFFLETEEDFKNLPPFDELFPEPPVVHPFDSAPVQLDQGERPLLILAMEEFLQNNEEDFIIKDEGITEADYFVFTDVYRQMLRLYYAFTGRDFFGSHGFITNFSQREEANNKST